MSLGNVESVLHLIRKYLLTKLELWEKGVEAVSFYYGGWSNGDSFCHLRRMAEREQEKTRTNFLFKST